MPHICHQCTCAFLVWYNTGYLLKVELSDLSTQKIQGSGLTLMWFRDREWGHKLIKNVMFPTTQIKCPCSCPMLLKAQSFEAEPFASNNMSCLRTEQTNIYVLSAILQMYLQQTSISILNTSI